MFTYKFVIRNGQERYPRVRLTLRRKKAELALKIELDPEVFADALSPTPKPQNLKWYKLFKFYRDKLDDLKIYLIENEIYLKDVAQLRELCRSALFPQSSATNSSAPYIGTNSSKSLIVDKSISAITATNSPNAYMATNSPLALLGNRETVADGLRAMAARSSKPGTARKYMLVLRRLLDFDPTAEKLLYQHITPEYLQRFDAFLALTTSLNGRSGYYKCFKAAINQAITEGKAQFNPFVRFKIKTTETAKRSLSLNALRELWAMKPTPEQQLGLDMFKLTFMLIGINFVDLFNCEPIIDGRINYRRAKTGKIYSIKVEPEAAQIIERYKGATKLLYFAERFDCHNTILKRINKSLKTIGGSKYPGLTTYWARHSWATMAAEIDVSDSVISLALGHTTGARVTEVYIHRNLIKVDKANRQILDLVLGGSEG